ncbi:hypothetical protein [Pelagerythrobacter aerophilus]|uniref:DUF4105 domain-containing protein n=1 Tax=Pelagerythrobacter aerophilus TaxID=2306995 RepID=A0A418NDA0_9SPHN|nr:hypothetical protein [Pelagerythrobacter aerophilus]RIV75792.1 hypothetical protein D2V04_16100 [Pelagerythrobacter aerophilus]
MRRLAALILSLVALAWSVGAAADVRMSFHSFNGSVLFGRFPHTFIVLEGTLDETGQPIEENYGFTAKTVSTRLLNEPVEHAVEVEDEKYIQETNRHFTVTLTDAQYWQVRSEVTKWRDAPGKYYDLDKRNCIHFVGAMARIAGLRVDYPKDMLRRPKKWLNHITVLNPQLGAEAID